MLRHALFQRLLQAGPVTADYLLKRTDQSTHQRKLHKLAFAWHWRGSLFPTRVDKETASVRGELNSFHCTSNTYMSNIIIAAMSINDWRLKIWQFGGDLIPIHYWLNYTPLYLHFLEHSKMTY